MSITSKSCYNRRLNHVKTLVSGPSAGPSVTLVRCTRILLGRTVVPALLRLDVPVEAAHAKHTTERKAQHPSPVLLVVK